MLRTPIQSTIGSSSGRTVCPHFDSTSWEPAGRLRRGTFAVYCLVTLLATAFAPGPARVQPVRCILKGTPNLRLGAYSAFTGAPINPDLINPLTAGHSVDTVQNNHLFVGHGGVVGEYNTANGSAPRTYRV
jgi:hypothetical protein